MIQIAVYFQQSIRTLELYSTIILLLYLGKEPKNAKAHYCLNLRANLESSA